MPIHRVLALATCSLTVAVAAIAGASASAATTLHPQLVGQDGPGFTITLAQGGKTVKTLKPGVYTLRVLDKSSIHNFHITGPGLNRATSVSKVYTVAWTVTLEKGTYTFVCDPHREIMRGSFRVA